MAGNVLPYKFIKLPYEVQFGGGLRENCTIRLRGRTFENPSLFNIRLSCGKADGDDTPFILESHFPSGKITMKSYDSSRWQNSEVAIPTSYFKPASEFDFTIECTPDAFLLKLETEEHTYDHKLPFYTVRFLTIKGDVNLQDVAITGVAAGEENIRLSVERQLPEKLCRREVVVCGIPVCARSHNRKMAFDFMTDTGNVAFHFNPRFYNQTIVRNNQVENVWGAEEKDLQVPFPFAYGVAFELTFHLGDDGCFKVRLNGYPLCKFERKTPGKLRSLSIHGSGIITKAEIL